MRRPKRAQVRFATVLMVGTGIALLAPDASAEDTKRACARSAETGQRLRDEGKPLAARAELVSCGRQACPSVIRAHCARWLEQIDAAIPTVVFRARSGAPGHAVDVNDVAVTMDGAPFLDTLDGQPHRVEPGAHAFKYTRAGAASVQGQVMLVAGEKNRILTVDFPGDASSAMASAPPAPSSDTEASSGTAPAPSTSIRPAAWVFVGLAVVGAGSFAYFGATGKSDLDSLRASCAGHCAQSNVSAAWNRLVVADISLGIGVVSAGLATWLFASPRRNEPAPTPSVASGIVVAPSLQGHGLSLGWHGAF